MPTVSNQREFGLETIASVMTVNAGYGASPGETSTRLAAMCWRSADWRRRFAPLLAIACAALISAAPIRADALEDPAPDWIGVAAIVEGDAEIQGPERPVKTLTVGETIFFGETIATGPHSAVTLNFIDGTALQIPPNATVQIDEFVFDPEAGADRDAISAIRGLLRLFGGPIEQPDQSPATAPPAAKSPSGAAGVRG